MASTKEFKIRLKSITSIKKITKAMKMVAASKLRHAQRACEAVRPVNASLQNTIPAGLTISGSKHLIVAITTDRGLCGGVNSSVVKTCKKIVKELVAQGAEVNIVCIGEKGRDAILRECGKYVQKLVNELTRKPVNFLAASAVSEELLSLSSFDAYTIVYNESKSVIAQNVTQITVPSYNNIVGDGSAWGAYEFDSDQASMLYNFFEFNLGIRLLSSLLENVTSEQGARMSAMESASKNAGDMINKLSIGYNKARQASITSELIDIISAAGTVAK